MGVSPRRLEGWEPKTFHEFVFERVWWKPWTWFPIGTLAVTEPEFTQDQVAWLLAHLDNLAEPRGSHGFLMSEATDPANQFAFRANEIPRIDFAAQAIGKAQDAFYKQPQNKDRTRAGDLWHAKKAGP